MRAIDDLLRHAQALREAGRLSEAARVYQTILDEDPRQFDALLLLGLVHLQNGQAADAEPLLADAATVNPASADAWSLRANALQQLGRIADALSSLDEAIALNPSSAALWSNRGNLLLTQGRGPEAVENYDRALAIDSRFADAWYNRGVALMMGGEHREAEASLDRALSLNPAHVEALEHRGMALAALARHEEALSSYEAALKLAPSNAELLLLRGDCLLQLDRCSEAVGDYDRVTALAPDNAALWLNRGVALSRVGRHMDALKSYESALRIRPQSAEAWHNRGSTMLALSDRARALSSYDKALAIRPDYAEAWKSRAVLLFEMQAYDDAADSFSRALSLNPSDAPTLYNRASALSLLARFEECARDCEALIRLDPNFPNARGLLLDARLHCCDWHGLAEARDAIEADVAAGKRVISPLRFLTISTSPKEQLRCARILVRDSYPAQAAPLWRGERYGHDKIRLAYLSADFHTHATAHLMAGVFEQHDRARFETYGMSFGQDEKSAMRSRLEGAFTHFLDVSGESDAAVAAKLRELEIDIAVDLKGYTRGGRPGILAYRPAPLQAQYLGYPGTMGAAYIDYLIADSVVIPDEQRVFYTEKIAYLPDSYQCNDSKRRIAEAVPSRKDAGLPETGFVFCCFNNANKILPEMFGIWMRILSSCAGSVLWLLGEYPAAALNLRREAQVRGVDPNRLIFAKRASLDQHLARLTHADLMLDTLPYCAHTTASDALWAGVPALTCLGASFAGRVAASLLTCVGLPELIVPSLQDYEKRACDLAQNRPALASLKAKLARNRNTEPLFDTIRITRNLEAAYTVMWERRQRGEPPESFKLASIATNGP